MNATTPVESGSGSAPASQEDLAQLRAEMAQMREEAKRMRDEAEQMKAEIAQDRIAMSDQLSVLDDRGGQWSDYLEIKDCMLNSMDSWPWTTST